MSSDSSSLGAAAQHATAQVAHETNKNLLAALDPYRRTVTTIGDLMTALINLVSEIGQTKLVIGACAIGFVIAGVLYLVN